ncbi:PREDICTED: dual 3',5'-cyclic-AMP and -GMP phosphodiesterase 11A [Thamnophis sirtalis]|uniref:Dual 3',5'-cyclic-AMP and -GMP phosphodiesterase 11A n=1 Tax=Thamnophis sirtalis TaxID=35019 RepID=A0A6I9XH10_9SAUR|nr:PREDICTED: dual 3',5'-cyclic-AMP and -GMP phosphodiesterase 11A [Thamnophis sirtalis]
MANPAGLDSAAVECFLDRHPELVEKWLKRRTALLSSKEAPAGAPDFGDGGAAKQPSSRHHHNGLSPRSSPSSTAPPGPEPTAGGLLQHRGSQKELRKSFARSKAIHVNLTYDEHLHARAQEPLSSARRRALLRKASSLPPTTAHLLSALLESRVNLPQYPPTALDYKRYLKQHNERQFFLELVKDISNDLDLSTLSYKILIFVCLMVDAERGSLFLVEGSGGGKKSLVSKVFDVHGGAPVLPCYSTENSNEMQLLWGKSTVGYVAEHGETVNMPDVYQDLPSQ